MDTAVTKKDGFKNPTNLTKIVKLFSSRKSSGRPLVDGSNAKNLDSKQNF